MTGEEVERPDLLAALQASIDRHREQLRAALGSDQPASVVILCGDGPPAEAVPRMIVIPLSYRRPPLTTNRMPRNHAHRARVVREIQDEVGWRVKGFEPVAAPVVVRLIWTVPDHRVRDASGPDPTLKAAQDGLVKAGVLPDDRHEIVRRSYCEIEHKPGEPMSMRIEIAPVREET